MRYTLSDFYYLWKTPIGRIQFFHGVFQRSWPLLWIIAFLYRRLFLRKVNIIVVIGSYGKTTTLRAVKTMLQKPLSRFYQGNCWSYVAAAVLRIRPGDEYEAIEIGIDGKGQMSKYARLVNPQLVVVTSIGSEHHRSLGDLQQTRSEKSQMIRQLSSRATVFLNGDDSNVLWMRQHTRARIVTFGFHPDNDVRAVAVYSTLAKGTRFRCLIDKMDVPVKTRFLGRHMVYPILSVLAVAHVVGIPLQSATERLGTLDPTPGRMQKVELKNNILLIRDEFKSSLETILRAFQVLEKMAAKRKIIVMGEVSEPPGSQGPIYRNIGNKMAAIFDQIVIVGVNYQRYAAGATRAGFSRERIVDAGNSIMTAIYYLKNHLESGDIVFIKGRDTQRLERISLALMGRDVKCDIQSCDARPHRCDTCPMLETGWKSKVII
jgi:UDP-N-acetylmuramoyl-tripeptide--D-alanyl-D-alanine ligase